MIMIEGKRITIRPAERPWTIRAGGAIIGETSRALELDEAGHDPVIYFPREDLAMAFLEPSETQSVCPFKGKATYWNIIAKSGPILDAGWSYDEPNPEAQEIAGYIAFHPDRVTVEEV